MIINGEVVSTILRGPQEMKKPVFIKKKKIRRKKTKVLAGRQFTSKVLVARPD